MTLVERGRKRKIEANDTPSASPQSSSDDLNNQAIHEFTVGTRLTIMGCVNYKPNDVVDFLGKEYDIELTENISLDVSTIILRPRDTFTNLITDASSRDIEEVQFRRHAL